MARWGRALPSSSVLRSHFPLAGPSAVLGQQGLVFLGIMGTLVPMVLIASLGPRLDVGFMTMSGVGPQPVDS